MIWRRKSVDDCLTNAGGSKLRRSIGLGQLLLLGVASIVGAGIFVLAAVGLDRAGPGLLLSFVIAATVCALCAFAYAELSAMLPVSGSAYTYTYCALGELMAWLVGWNLILEYTVAAAAVSVGWSGYAVGVLHSFGVPIPRSLTVGFFAGDRGGINIPAILLVAVLAGLLTVGTRTSARVASVLVVTKLAVLILFIVIALPHVQLSNFTPFMPFGFGSHEVDGVTRGVMAATALIFFAYLGFDTVSTAAEETRNPNRNIPLAIIGALAICTLLYILVAVAMIGTTPRMKLVGSADPLAAVLRGLGLTSEGNLVGLAAVIALPSVLLMLMFGQSRIFFSMSRDGLLPAAFSRVHSRFNTPHVITLATALVVATVCGFFAIGEIAELSNTGTLFAFIAVSVAALVLRHTDPSRPRPFRCHALWLIGPLAVLGCLYLLKSLPTTALVRFGAWNVLGLLVYFGYSCRKSPMRTA